MSRPPRRTHIAVAIVALIALGAAAGIAADRLIDWSPRAEAARLPDDAMMPKPTPEGPMNPIEAIDRAVGLRPDQRARVAAIIERRQTDLDAAWAEARTRILATVDSVIAEIAAELDPDQAARFRALHDELYGPPHSDHPLPR